MRAGVIPVEVTTDRAPAYPRVLDELIPSALHTVERYTNDPVEADHGRLKARLRPIRGLKRTAQRGFSPPFTPSSRTSPRPLRHRNHVPARHQLRTAFDEFATI